MDKGAHLRPERRGAVRKACEEAVAATDKFSRVVAEAKPDDRSAADRARHQLDMALSGFRYAPCEGVEDIREKCRTFRRLEELLSPDDPRLQLVACGLVREMAEAIMDSVESVVSRGASRQGRLWPDRRSSVRTACQEAVAATDRFSSLRAEAAPGYTSAAERARRQLDMALSEFRCAPCEGLEDISEKCRTFLWMEELLSPDDPRLQLVACDLVREMAGLPEDQAVRPVASETVAPKVPDRRAASKAPAQTETATAHHAVLTAIQGIFRLDRRLFVHAREQLARAIELDPDYAAAYAWMAYWSILGVGLGWVRQPKDVTTLADDSAERAVKLDPLDARAAAIAGHVKAYLLHDVRSALHLHARAIELNPNLPVAWTLSSWSRIYNGEHAAAIQLATMSRSLSPQDPHNFLVEHAVMTAHFFSRHLEEAEMLAEAVLQQNPQHASALNVRLAILGHMGRYEEARECLAMLRGVGPDVSIESIISRPPLKPKDRAFYVEGLRGAGVPQ